MKRSINRVLETSLVGCLFLIVAVVLVASVYFFVTGHTHLHLFAGICCLIAALVSFIYAMRELGEHGDYVRQQEAEGELDEHIDMALMKMESVGVYFRDEDSANQQLCLMLKELMPGVDIRLIPHGRESGGAGDIRVANTIIEGKLDLETNKEMHRLVGQLQDYCSKTSCQIRVVVYGRLRPDFRQRIEGLTQYYDRILLHHIGGIKTRKPTGKRYTVTEQMDDDDN
jgi:hypothetical protein